MSIRELWRVFHIGPLVALGIIKFISGVTLFCCHMLWPQWTHTALLVVSIFAAFSGTTLYCFLHAILVGPGHVPAGWSPGKEEHKKLLQYCARCHSYKAPRSHHCSSCNRCVLKMDHHCPWINNCVGHCNHASFVWFLLAAVAASLQALVINCYTLYRLYVTLFGSRQLLQSLPLPFSLHLFIVGCVFSAGMALSVVLGLSILAYHQIKSILQNVTGIEYWILEKARYRRQYRFKKLHCQLMERQNQGECVETEFDELMHRRNEDQFVNPYSVGAWRNLRLVMACGGGGGGEGGGGGWCRPAGDGIWWWPLAAGCDQFTLTREQLEQKREKRERTFPCLVLKSYSGYWLPCTKGLRTVYHAPCTMEPRIATNPGDVVLVTRYRKYWLYGEKVATTVKQQQQQHQQQQQQQQLPQTGRVRGWFPRDGTVDRHSGRPVDFECLSRKCYLEDDVDKVDSSPVATDASESQQKKLV